MVFMCVYVCEWLTLELLPNPPPLSVIWERAKLDQTTKGANKNEATPSKGAISKGGPSSGKMAGDQWAGEGPMTWGEGV